MVSLRRGTIEFSFRETLLLWGNTRGRKLTGIVEIWFATSEYLKQELNSIFLDKRSFGDK
jgi:hypothetical protein